MAPAKTPPDLLVKLSADIRKAVQAPDAKQKLEAAGFRVTSTSPAEFAQLIRTDSAVWGKAVAATGFQAD